MWHTRCSLDIIKLSTKLLILVLFIVSCEEESPERQSTSNGNINTLENSQLGGDEGNISDYFYDLNLNFNAKFLYYQKESPVANTILNPNLLNPNRDTLNIKTFPDYILKVEPEDVILQTAVLPFDETNEGECIIIEDCDIDGNGELSSTHIFPSIPQVDSLDIYSHQFSSILKLEWDTEDNRYKPILQEYEYESGNGTSTSQWLYNVETVFVDSDVYQYDSLIYVTPLDTILTNPEGQFYFDQSEYIQRDSIYSAADIVLTETFNFTRNILSSDSIMYRINTDCNLDGIWTSAEIKIVDYNNDGDTLDVVYEFNDINGNGILDDDENQIYDYNDDGDLEDILFEFEDVGNGNLDVAEVYWDADGDGERDPFEPFEDLNCNGIWDEEESVDSGNGIWDDDEYFDGSEIEGNTWDDGDRLSKLNDAPVNLLVDYSDPAVPVAVPTIVASTSVKLRGNPDGNDYIPIIPEDIVDVVTKTIPEIDSVRTTFSNKIITQIIDSTLYQKEYKILKSQFPSSSSDRNYNYSILNDDDHIYKLHFPSYFLPYGFYFQPSQIEDGFWYEDFLALEVMYFTYDGKIREGEHVFFDSVYVTSHGDYHIETDYEVEKTEVIVPMRKVLFDVDANVCTADGETLGSSNEDCLTALGNSAYDSTLTDCYKIIKTTTMTMLGSGVEYGERTSTFLAEGLGIVKDDLEIRWSEQIGIDGEVWSPYSRLELAEFRETDDLARNQGILYNLMGQKRINIEELDQLDGDPFRKGRSAGIQAVELPSN